MLWKAKGYYLHASLNLISASSYEGKTDTSVESTTAFNDYNVSKISKC